MTEDISQRNNTSGAGPESQDPTQPRSNAGRMALDFARSVISRIESAPVFAGSVVGIIGDSLKLSYAEFQVSRIRREVARSSAEDFQRIRKFFKDENWRLLASLNAIQADRNSRYKDVYDDLLQILSNTNYYASAYDYYKFQDPNVLVGSDPNLPSNRVRNYIELLKSNDSKATLIKDFFNDYSKDYLNNMVLLNAYAQNVSGITDSRSDPILRNQLKLALVEVEIFQASIRARRDTINTLRSSRSRSRRS